ncbi:MAG: nitroreductase family protein [Desulfobacula sp.]|nr:nitroreductase family protein [Desulfobacula sp.]
MNLFHIDTEKCNKDGICAVECPAHIIEMTGDGPVPATGAEEFCIACGHCVAVCPQGALTLSILAPQDCLDMDKDLVLDERQTEHFLRSRRSIRRYKDRPVPRDLFEKALTIACCAPSGSNRQPVKWLVVDKKEDVHTIGGHVINWMRYLLHKSPETAKALKMDALVEAWDKGSDRICRDAPQLVFAHASNEFGSASADCHTALAYLELALTGFGLGSCWAGYVNYAAGQWPDLKKMLALPETHTCHGALMVGFPKFHYLRAPRRNAPDIRYHG